MYAPGDEQRERTHLDPIDDAHGDRNRSSERTFGHLAGQFKTRRICGRDMMTSQVFLLWCYCLMTIMSLTTTVVGNSSTVEHVLPPFPHLRRLRTISLPPAEFSASLETTKQDSLLPEIPMHICTSRSSSCAYKAKLSEVSDIYGYETMYANGARTWTEVQVDSAETTGKSKHSSRRYRRQVYGSDGRFSITDEVFVLRHPFAAAVKLSTGCSGVLVSEKHVLTAAHCLHDGRDYVHGAKGLRVGFLHLKRARQRSRSLVKSRRRGRSWSDAPELSFRWSRARRTMLPKGWMHANENFTTAVDFDYAVVELRRPHKQQYLELSVSPSTESLPGKRIHFSGFDDDRDGTLVYRFCTVTEESTELMLQRCDARPGASGSGVYMRRWDPSQGQWSRRLIGVFSGHRLVELEGTEDGDPGETKDFNVAVRITPLKLAQICLWLEESQVKCTQGWQ